MQTAPDTAAHPPHPGPSGAARSSDLAYLLAVIRRQSLLDWTHHTLSMAIIVVWTLDILGKGPM